MLQDEWMEDSRNPDREPYYRNLPCLENYFFQDQGETAGRSQGNYVDSVKKDGGKVYEMQGMRI